MPNGLIAFLSANPNCVRADLFEITLPNGEYLLATDGQFDVTVPSGTDGWTGATTTFSASLWGTWTRGAITSEASFSMAANTMQLTCLPQLGTTYPGAPTGILSAALNGLFDACQIKVWTVYIPIGGYNDVSAGVETKFWGQITKIDSLARNKVVFECADFCYLLNVKIPSRVIQANCPWGFADANCSLSASSYTTTFTAATGTTSWIMTPSSAFGHAAGYYTQGVVTCTSGANIGLSQCVKLHDSSGNLELMYPWIFPPTVGDSFKVIAGCSKAASDCGQKFNNLIHFGGMPFTPVPQSVV
jgi:uncharacterized phage protein (TIGR02218 family)